MKKLVTYIRNNLKNGFSEEDIKAKLLSSGYPIEVVQKGFKLAHRPRISLLALFLLVIIISGIIIVKISLLKRSIDDAPKVVFDLEEIHKQESALTAEIDAGNPVVCSGFTDKIVSDYCSVYSLSCDGIDDFELNQICQRMLYRPHMKTFIFNRDEEDILNNSDCYPYSGAFNQICNFRRFVSDSNSDISKGTKLCERFGNDKTTDECEFYLLVSNLNRFKVISDDLLGSFITYCSDFRTNHWRSECYFLIADSLTFSDQNRYLNNISQVCTKADSSFNYGCFSHVALNINEKDRAVSLDNLGKFCKIIPNFAKQDCYISYGITLGDNNEDYSKQYHDCISINNTYTNYCIYGLQWSNLTRNINVKDFTYDKFIEESTNCLRMDKSQIGDCYYFFGQILARNNDNFEKKYSYCLNVDKNYINDCLNGIFSNVRFTYKGNIKKMIELCSTLDPDIRAICMDKTMHTLNWTYPENDPELTASCNLFSDELRTECINRYSQ